MRKNMGNQKGFSLVEVLIVMTIIAIVSSLAINMFVGMSEKSRRKTDQAQAVNIKNAILAYVTETNDTNLMYLKAKSDEKVSKLVEDVLANTNAGDEISKKMESGSLELSNKTFGPYMEKKTNGINPTQEGGSKKWKVTYTIATQQCDVEVADEDVFTVN